MEIEVLKVLPALPEFAKAVLNKAQFEIHPEQGSNCLNAAFNFHDVTWRHRPYTTSEFLNRIKTDFFQIAGPQNPQFGDLVVFWYRNGGSWDQRKIEVDAINPVDADFPYGLVFEHIAVRVSETLVFHKPDPDLTSAYQLADFNALQNRIGSAALPGFEMTFHRIKNF